MHHWSDKYLGEPYVQETGDCAVFVEKVTKAEFGIDPQLPTSHALTLRNQADQILSAKDNFAIKIDNPTDGCPVLLIARAQVCHIGVMCFIADEWWVLHADKGVGFVVRERLRDITKYRYKIEGFYKWK
jgi:hypothetical protein